MSIGAFYQCFKQPKAFEHCLLQFRKYYPVEELWIVNDGGDPNLEYISKKYNPSHYEYKERIDTEAIALIFRNKTKIIEWLSRFRKFVLATKCDFILLLEDDVFVMKKTDISDLKYEINGCNYGARFNNDMIEKIIQCSNSLVPSPLYYGGCGGCFMKTAFFRRIFENFAEIESAIDIFSFYCNDFASDKLISYLTWIYGGTIDMYPGFVEKWYSSFPKRLESKTIEVLHQYKDLYECNKQQGYLFIANGETYANMLKTYTIPSIRHFDMYRPISILTSTPEFFNATLYNIIFYDVDKYSKLYSHLLAKDNMFFILGTISKLISFDLTPYKETLYCDADIINMKDIEPFWNYCSQSKKEVIICGGSDEKNRAPASWHWNTIDEVMNFTSLNIPRNNAGMFYWRNRGDFMTTIEPYLLNPPKYKIKPWFRGNYADEIFISIYLSIKNIFPEADEDYEPPNPNSLQTYRTTYESSGSAQFFHIFNKDVLPDYFRLFQQKNPSYKPMPV